MEEQQQQQPQSMPTSDKRTKYVMVGLIVIVFLVLLLGGYSQNKKDKCLTYYSDQFCVQAGGYLNYIDIPTRSFYCSDINHNTRHFSFLPDELSRCGVKQ